MTQRTLYGYKAEIQAGPGDVLVVVTITYYDKDGLELGRWTDDAMAFGYTWKDVAKAIAQGIATNRLQMAGYHTVEHPSPHVDLT
jgi:hypothetical protein